MIATLLFLVSAVTAPITDTAALDAAAAAFAGAPPGAEGGPLAPIDPRLRLAACSVDPTLAWRSARQDAILIQCPDPGGWRVYVAVRMAAAATPRVDAGLASSPSARPEPVIRRGDPVSLVASSSGFSVSTSGVAMSDAAAGARLAIRIEGRPQPVQAVAVEPGRATIPRG